MATFKDCNYPPENFYNIFNVHEYDLISKPYLYYYCPRTSCFNFFFFTLGRRRPVMQNNTFSIVLGVLRCLEVRTCTQSFLLINIRSPGKVRLQYRF